MNSIELDVLFRKKPVFVLNIVYVNLTSNKHHMYLLYFRQTGSEMPRN